MPLGKAPALATGIMVVRKTSALSEDFMVPAFGCRLCDAVRDKGSPRCTDCLLGLVRRLYRRTKTCELANRDLAHIDLHEERFRNQLVVAFVGVDATLCRNNDSADIAIC